MARTTQRHAAAGLAALAAAACLLAACLPRAAAATNYNGQVAPGQCVTVMYNFMSCEAS